MAEQRSRPGEVPEVAQRLPDEAVAEELFLVEDEPVVGRNGRLIVLVASVDGAYLAHQVPDLPRVDPLGLLALYLRVEDGGKEVVAVGRQVARVLVDARVV